jgi:GST-like protein
VIDLYFWPTPNGFKATIMLEEAELEYRVNTIDIHKGDQLTPEFIAISPNNRIPAIVDHNPDTSNGFDASPYSVFESGAILIYLAEKTGVLLPSNAQERNTVLQWVMFQMANVGPMFGQNGFFQGYCREDVPLAKERYHNITNQLYGVMDKRLSTNEYLAGGEYSIADVATYPWTTEKQRGLHRIDIEKYPNVKRWAESVSNRPGVQRGMAIMAKDQTAGNPDAKHYEVMYGATQFSSQEE